MKSRFKGGKSPQPHVLLSSGFLFMRLSVKADSHHYHCLLSGQKKLVLGARHPVFIGFGKWLLMFEFVSSNQ